MSDERAPGLGTRAPISLEIQNLEEDMMLQAKAVLVGD